MTTLPYRRCTYATNLTYEQAVMTARHFRELGFKEVEITHEGIFINVTAYIEDSTRRIMYPEDYEVTQ